MNVMPLHEAWAVLGKDAGSILKNVAQIPRGDRSIALSRLVEEAKRLAKPLLAKHHPDRGGDVVKFRKVQDALTAIVHHTERFEKMAIETVRKAAEIASRRPVFIEVKR